MLSLLRQSFVSGSASSSCSVTAPPARWSARGRWSPRCAPGPLLPARAWRCGSVYPQKAGSYHFAPSCSVFVFPINPSSPWQPSRAQAPKRKPAERLISKKNVAANHTKSAATWCEERDLNSQGKNHTPLKRARMPIPPPSHSKTPYQVRMILYHIRPGRVKHFSLYAAVSCIPWSKKHRPRGRLFRGCAPPARGCGGCWGTRPRG